MMIARSRFRQNLAKRVAAAIRLQNAWRKSKKCDIVNVVKAFKNKHATIIQNYMRGYHVTQHLLLKIRKEKLHQNESHFDKMKDEIELQAVLKI